MTHTQSDGPRTHPAETLVLPGPGGADRVRSPLVAVVVGGGLAGVAAATVLAERGVAVTLLEREGYLGGRAGAWTDRLATGEPFEMERGFHAFFRQYYNLRALLRRIDAELALPRPRSTTTRCSAPAAPVESFAGLPRPRRCNVLELIRRTPTPAPRDLLRVNKRAALAMLGLRSRARPTAATTATTAARLPRLAALPARRAADALRRLRALLLQPRGGDVGGRAADDVPLLLHREPRGAGLRRARRARSRSASGRRSALPGGARGATSAPARAVSRAGAARRAEAGASRSTARSRRMRTLVVLALDVPALQAVVAALARPRRARARAAPSRRSSVTLPFAVWRLWLDRPSPPGRSPFVGTTGLGSLDNISLYDLFEDESRRWALRTGRLGRRAPRLRRAAGHRRRPPCARPPARVPRLLPGVRGAAGPRGALPAPARLPGLLARVATPTGPASQRRSPASPWPATSSACRCRARSWSAPRPRASWPPTTSSRPTA